MAERADVEKLFAWANQQLGPIDILVNAAGVNLKNRLMSNMTPPDWDRVLAINATGVYNAMYAVLPQMRERQGRADHQHLVDLRQAGRGHRRRGL